MPWVKFVAAYDFSPSARNGSVTIAYRAGTIANVTRECLEMALAAKAAEPVKNPKREAAQ